MTTKPSPIVEQAVARQYLVPVDEGEGQLDVDRFYRYNQTLQEFFDEAAAVETLFVANGG